MIPQQDRLARQRPDLTVDGRLRRLSRRCFDVDMASDEDRSRVVTAHREIGVAAERLFELIADPAQQPRWDGNDNLADAADGQRVRAVGDMFTMTLTGGRVRENHIVEFSEGS